MNPFLVFGLINLIMIIIGYPMLKTKVTNPNCKDEIKSVKTGKIGFTIYSIITLIVTIVGIILIFI